MSESLSELRQAQVKDTRHFVNSYLVPRLPYSLPLLRRCQFHSIQNRDDSNSEIWVTGLSMKHSSTSQHEQQTSIDGISAIQEDQPWIAAHIDLSNSGQTQVWVFASWEDGMDTKLAEESHSLDIRERLFDMLRAHLYLDHIPRMSDSPPAQWQQLKDAGKRVSEPYSRYKVLFGTVSDTLWVHFEPNAKQSVARTDMSYFKYVIRTHRTSLETSLRPPHGLRFETMHDDHLQTVIDRTDIPRSIQTLRQLPSVGLYDESNTPIAWGLLGKDASISSLHTEPEFRRRGLAELTARKLIAAQMSIFEESDISNDALSTTVWSHADVSESNMASRKVMEKVGGLAMWRTAWIELDFAQMNS